jgi:predicted nucleic acid-binding protein
VIALDSSVVIAALSRWHPAHEGSRAAAAREDRVLPSHVAFETAAVLSRLPKGYRITSAVVFDALERIFTRPWLTLDGDAARSCLARAVAVGIGGGALYDALIAATAREHGATLLSADRRAQEAYEAMGAHVSYLEL